MAPDEDPGFAATGEALDILRPLVLAEQQRMTNLNPRALGLISASSIAESRPMGRGAAARSHSRSRHQLGSPVSPAAPLRAAARCSSRRCLP
jgi:hypothetical protein